MTVTYPTRSIKLRTMIGYSVPPQLEPRAITPRAAPSLRLNQWAGTAMIVPNIIPQATCENIQYSLRMVPKIATYASRDSLAENELPVFFALGREEGRGDEHHTS